MGKKWGSNEGIQIGDVFRCSRPFFFAPAGAERAEHYQVTALKGKTQVVLHAIHTESYINEGIAEDSLLYDKRKRTRPVLGQFLTEDDEEVTYGVRVEIDGKEVRFHRAEVTAWVLFRPEQTPDHSFRLKEVGWENRIFYDQARPKDWEPWDAEMIRKLEEYYRQQDEALTRYLHGEKDVPSPEYPI